MLDAEVKFIPEQDLQTIDALWKAASGGKFGYSVQKEVWMQQSKYWSRFFKKIDWTQVCWAQHVSYEIVPRPCTTGEQSF